MERRVEAPTLRALLGRRELRLRLEGGEALGSEALDRPIRWVHSSDLSDPTPFLSDGLALLTTGTQFSAAPDDPGPYDAYVRRLSARGVAALGFGTEVVRDGIPPALAEACRAQGMPLFEVPYRTPFIAVARANAEAIAAEAYARRSWALAAQRAISLAALRPDGLGATLAELARQLDTWVGMFDAAGALVREYPPGRLDAPMLAGVRAEADAVLRRGARAASSLRVDGVPFTLQTLGRGGRLRGVIAIGAGELDQEGRSVVTSVIAMAGLALEQTQGLARARGLLRAGLVQSLLHDDPTLARRIARDLWGGLPAAPVHVAVTDAGATRRDAVAEHLELLADEHPGRLFFGRADDAMILVLDPRAAGVLDDVASRFGVRVGLSDPTAYEAFSTAVRDARVALGRGVDAGPRVTRFADIAGKGMVVALGTDEARAVAAATLAPLRSHDAAHASDLVGTLRAWLENDGGNEASARALGVHRHTVRARIALAARLLDRDLSTFPVRADLWAALQLAPS